MSRVLASTDAEQQVLGAILFRETVYYDVMEILSEDDFYDRRHGAIWNTIAALIATQKRVNASTVRDYLVTAKGVTIEESYLDQLADAVMSPGEAVGYAKHVADLGKRRRFIAACDEAKKAVQALDPREDSASAIHAGEAEILNATRADTQAIRSISEWAQRSINRLAGAQQGDLQIGLTWGLAALDDILGPALPGKLIILSGRPGEGKSAAAGQAGAHFATQIPTVAFSIEMDGEEWAERELSKRSRIAAWRIHRGKLSRPYDDLEILNDHALGEMRNLPFYVEETATLTIDQIQTKAIRYKHQLGMGALLIDHLHIITKKDRRQDDLDATDKHCRALKELAKRLKIPIVALAQMNKDIRMRDNYRPRSADLMYYSAIEKHADVIVFAHRPEVAHADRKPDPITKEKEFNKWESERLLLEGKAEFIQTKLRGGKGNQTRECRFLGPLMLFEDFQAPSGELRQTELEAF